MIKIDEGSIVSKKQIHISIDDVHSGLNERKFILYLKELSFKYDLKITLYIQNWDDLITSNVANLEEIANESAWLKLGIHTTKDGKCFDHLSYSEGAKECVEFLRLLNAKGVRNESIDPFMRLHKFAGSKEALCGIRDVSDGIIKGFLAADDSRCSYYFTDNNCEKMRGYKSNEVFNDLETNLMFKSTDLRLDWFDKRFVSKYDYKVPSESAPYQELLKIQNEGYLNGKGSFVIFTHEWQIFRNGHFTLRKRWIEEVCKFAQDYGYLFGEVR